MHKDTSCVLTKKKKWISELSVISTLRKTQ